MEDNLPATQIEVQSLLDEFDKLWSQTPSELNRHRLDELVNLVNYFEQTSIEKKPI